MRFAAQRDSQGVLAPVFSPKLSYAQRDPVLAIAKSVHETTTRMSSSCVRFDSLTQVEILRARDALLTAAASAILPLALMNTLYVNAERVVRDP